MRLPLATRTLYEKLKIVPWIICCVLATVPARAEVAMPRQHSEQSGQRQFIAVIPPDSPPTYYRDQSGKAAGFAVDVMDAVAKRAGFQVSYVFEDSWADIIELMKSGKADLAPGMGVSKEREKDLVFSSPIDAFPISLFVRTRHPGIDATPGVHTVGVIRGSVAFEKLKDRPNIDLSLYESFPQGLFDLLAGKIEAFACPEPTLWQLARESGVNDRIKVVDKPIAEITRAIAVRKDHPEQLDRLNDVIKDYVGSPMYQRAYIRWYGKPIPYWTPVRIITVASALFLVSIGIMAVWRYRTLIRLNRELQKALAEIKTLHGILPICSSCKKIRDDKGAWHQMEVYIRDHTNADFSHGLCADCAQKLYSKYTDKMK